MLCVNFIGQFPVIDWTIMRTCTYLQCKLLQIAILTRTNDELKGLTKSKKLNIKEFLKSIVGKNLTNFFEIIQLTSRHCMRDFVQLLPFCKLELR